MNLAALLFEVARILPDLSWPPRMRQLVKVEPCP